MVLQLRIGLLQPLQRDDVQARLRLGEALIAAGSVSWSGVTVIRVALARASVTSRQHVALLRGGAAHGRDEVGDEVGAALIVVLDVGPFRLGLLLGASGSS